MKKAKKIAFFRMIQKQENYDKKEGAKVVGIQDEQDLNGLKKKVSDLE